MTKKIAPYGTWESPITPNLATSSTPAYSQIRLGGQKTYWAVQDGASQYITSNDNDRFPHEGNVASMVHEYGGGDFAVYPKEDHDVLFYINSDDQQWYWVDSRTPKVSTQITKDTNDNVQTFFSNAILSLNGTWLICIREEHFVDSKEVFNSLVAVNTSTGQVNVLAQGNDFYSSPAINAEGTQIAWLTWNHPQMPWDGTVLNTAQFSEQEGHIGSVNFVAGGQDESIFQPSFSPKGELHFVSDRTHGWWHIYRVNKDMIEPVLAEPIQGEFAEPAWELGYNTYAFLANGDIIARYNIINEHSHVHQLGILSQGQLSPLKIPYHHIEPSLVITPNNQIFCIAGSTDSPSAIRSFNLADPQIITSYNPRQHDDLINYFSNPQFIQFTTRKGDRKHNIFAYYYPPHNPNFEAPNNEKPPVIIVCHGGPTSQTSTELKLGIQFWTSQGFAVVDVDYSGSTGYGRAYRDSLKGNWGLLDIADCLEAATYLAEKGMVDAKRISIRGGSAGGYVVFSALAFHTTCAAGVSLFGIGDLKTLATGTHKFESHYVDTLVAPLTADNEFLYYERSPKNFVSQFNCPVLILQGGKDQIVPVDQAINMAQTLNEKGKAYALKIYPEEKHGFRNSEVKRDALISEVDFLKQCYDLPRSLDAVVEIHNLPSKSKETLFAKVNSTLFVTKEEKKEDSVRNFTSMTL